MRVAAEIWNEGDADKSSSSGPFVNLIANIASKKNYVFFHVW